MTTKKEQAIAIAESFVADWDLQQWCQDHGTWASAEWADEREEYDAAHEALTDLLAEHKDASRVDGGAAQALKEAFYRLVAAAEALDGQVRPDESDYIAEGTIDPDNVEDECMNENKIDGGSSQAWNCIEGHQIHLLDDGRVVYNWYRQPYGNTNRRARDLFVVAGEIDSEE